MNYAYKNYLYIYNIKLIEKNTLLIKKKHSNMFFVLFILKNFFINLTEYVFYLFLRIKTVF